MIAGWALLGFLLAAVVVAVGRGFIRAARLSIRRDLVALGEMQQLAGMLAKLTTTAYGFASPLLKERTSWVGWLWWRTRIGPSGEVERDMGWALTYRRARSAAGAPLAWRSLSGSELVVVPQDNQPRAPVVEEPNSGPAPQR